MAALISTVYQGTYGEAIVGAIAHAAGCGVARPVPDTGTDFIVTAGDHLGFESEPQLHLQVKTTSPTHVTDRTVFYDVDLTLHKRLTSTKRTNPLILVVVIAPYHAPWWLKTTEESIIFRQSAYWTSLRGEQASSRRTKQRVHIPRVNLFNCDAVTGMLNRIEQGGHP
jgi:hypothetical protein